MPELPEVETTLAGIKPYVDQAVLDRVVVRNPALRWPVPVDDLQHLIGLQIVCFIADSQRQLNAALGYVWKCKSLSC